MTNSEAANLHFNYEISSPSSSVTKLLDQFVHSAMTFKLDINDVLVSIFQADPDCFAAQLLLSAFELSEHLADVSIDRCHALKEKLGSRVTDWESKWYDAVTTFKSTSARKACHVLMDLLAEYPFDLMAVYVGIFWSLYAVDKFVMRDLIGRVLPFHPASHPYRPLLDSLYGFALLEMFSTDSGAKLADKAFQFDPNHPWMIHAACHSMEYCGKVEEGLSMLLDKRECYKDTAMGFHNTWHVAFFQTGMSTNLFIFLLLNK